MKKILYSNISGTGKALLIIHGFLGSGDNWVSLGRKFSKDFEVHRIDMRNHGRSFHDDTMNYKVMSQDLLHYCQYYNLQQVSIIGHSMGGKAAMYFAVENPDIIQKLIVVDIAPKSYKRGHDFILDSLSKIDFSIHKSRDEFDKILQKGIANKAIRQFVLKNIYRRSKNEFDFRFNLQVLIKSYPRILEALPSNLRFDKETLFLKGAYSDYIKATDLNLIRAHFPKAKLLTINRSGHWLHAENPIEFYSSCIGFLQTE